MEKSLAQTIVTSLDSNTLEKRNVSGETYLETAIRCGQWSIASQIIHKVPPEALSLADKDGYTALHRAVLADHTDTVQALMDADPRLVGRQTADGRTALVLAMEYQKDCHDLLAYRVGKDRRVAYISVSRHDLHQNPHRHLLALSRLLHKIKSDPDQRSLDVQFLNDDFSLQRGIDAGGLSRAYIDALFSALFAKNKAEGSHLFKHQASGILPRSDARDSSRLFRALGRVLMFCYYSFRLEDRHYNEALTIGRHFAPEYFQFLLSLSSTVLDRGIAGAPEKLKLAAYEVYLKSDPSAHLFVNALQYLQGLTSEATNLFYTVQAAAEEQFEDPPDWLVGDQESLDGHEEEARRILLKMLGQYLDPILNAAIEIAKGMRSVLPHDEALDRPGRKKMRAETWDLVRVATSGNEFAVDLQGLLDPLHVAGAIKIEHSSNADHVEADFLAIKVDWIKQWILSDKRQNEDLERFLRFCTGSATMDKALRITVKASPQPSPFPTASTCAATLFVSDRPSTHLGLSDSTCQGFWKALEYAIGCTDFDLS